MAEFKWDTEEKIGKAVINEYQTKSRIMLQ